jgi:hypothetical protein
VGKELGRVTDPAALAAVRGPRARLSITVPAAWLDGPLSLEIEAPRLLPCDRCDGGGCDGCERSGALRAPEEASGRRLLVRLPAEIGEGVMVRLAAPFDGSPIEQLLVAVRVAEAPSACVRRVEAAVAELPRARPWSAVALVVGLVLLAALLVAALQ